MHITENTIQLQRNTDAYTSALAAALVSSNHQAIGAACTATSAGGLAQKPAKETDCSAAHHMPAC
jgi:hypothetical protein